MIDRDTFLRVKDWFFTCLQQNEDPFTFECDLLSRKFNFAKELIKFLDGINNRQYARCRIFTPCDRDLWELNALNSILKEAKELEILKNIRRDPSEEYRFDLIQELIKKMQNWLPYCMIICNFLANSKLSDTPDKYSNLSVLCKYWIDCQKALENNSRFEYQLSELFI